MNNTIKKKRGFHDDVNKKRKRMLLLPPNHYHPKIGQGAFPYKKMGIGVIHVDSSLYKFFKKIFLNVKNGSWMRN